MTELIKTAQDIQRLRDRNNLQDVMLELLNSKLDPIFKLGVQNWLMKVDEKLHA